MIKTIGSQKRERLAETDYQKYSVLSGGRVILQDLFTGRFELWFKNDHSAGYVIDIGGFGYEFVTSNITPEMLAEESLA